MESITHCHSISHLITSHYGHHILHCISSTSSQLALFQTTPHSTSHHSSPPRTFHIAPAPLTVHYSTLKYHISNRTTSATLCITPLTSRIGPHFTLLVYHKTPHSMYSTPHQFQITPYIGRIYASHSATSHTIFYTTLHRISHAPHLALFHHI